MTDIINSLNALKECHVQVLEYLKSGKDIFTNVKKAFQTDFQVDLDFENFEDLDIFDKCDVENNDKFLNIDNKSNLLKADIQLKSVIHNLDSERNELFKECMSEVKRLSDRIHKVSKVQKFIKYWILKHSDDYQLNRYPESFINNLESIPGADKPEIQKLISQVHPLNINKEKLGNSVNSGNILIDSTNKNIAGTSTSTLEDSADWLPSFVDKDLPGTKPGQYKPGYTIDAGISLMDFTVRDSLSRQSEQSGATVDKTAGDYDFSVLNPDENSCHGNIGGDEDERDDPLNRAFCSTEEDEVVITGNMPSFMNDTARIPEIEQLAYPYDSMLEDPLAYPAHSVLEGHSINQISLCGLTGINLDDSVDNGEAAPEDSNTEGDKRRFYIDEFGEKREKADDDVSSSRIEMSSIDFDYSFGRSFYGDCRHGDGQ